MKRVILLAAICLTAACSQENNDQENVQKNVEVEAPQYQSEIRWTSYGIPHVRANDWGSLGYGFAYATATDGFCVIAKDVAMVNGELSQHMGPDGGNRESDIFYKSILTDQLLNDFNVVQSEKAQVFSVGYVQGFNRYLKDNRDNLPASCAGKSWVREIDTTDIVRLNIGVGIRYGAGRYMKNMADAKPPGQQVSIRPADFSGFDGIGSNAVAMGKDVTESGRGILLGNPHYPWRGSSRFHMIHTTIPGEVDVMGVSLLNTSRIAIGFNKDIAWTHTVSTALRATLYELSLNPDNAMQYSFNNEMRDIEKRNVTIEVKTEQGEKSTESHDVYFTHFGPIVMSNELPWNDNKAYVVRDANVRNFQTAITYDALNKASSVDEVEAAISHQGVSFTNTIAADKHGTAFYADISVTPNVDKTLFEQCRITVDGVPNRLVVLDGSKKNCEWKTDSRSKVDNALPAEEMPRIRRHDYVSNSNDSYWLSNPSAPLEGYSPIIGNERAPRTLRTRAGLTLIDSLLKQGKVGPADVQNLVYAHRNFGAELLLDDVLTLCKRKTATADIQPSCNALAGWDRKQISTSTGAQVWTEFWRTAQNIPQLYSVPFDANDPVNTPRGIAIDKPEVASALRDSLLTAQQVLEEAGIALDSPWGSIQYAERNGEKISIPGGEGWGGMFSMIRANLQKGKGYTPIVHGNSYIQVISWDKAGKLDARGILTYSQSQEPESPHYADQTHLYSKGEWLTLPFSDEEISADPNLRTLQLIE